jgi:putative MATE family efflux protein
MASMKSGRDCTEGSIPRHLLAVALPMLIGNFLQSGYTIIDAVWVGRVVGKSAMGAIAVSFPILFIFIAVAAGATMATTILISQYFGAKNYEQAQKTIGASLFFALLISAVITTAGFLSTDAILKLVGTPASIVPVAAPYLKMHFIGFTIMYAGYLIGAILRGIGDSKTPLYFMVVGVIINAILDPLLIIGVGPFPRLGLVGAAVASIVGQAVGTVVGYIYLRRKKNLVAIDLHKITWNGRIVKLILKIGFPTMIQHSAVSLGMAAVTSVVNGFGDAATAAFGAAGRIDTVSFFPAMSIGMAVSIISGQNIGAQKYDRVHRTFRWGLLMTVTISGFFSLFYLAIPRVLLSAFLSDPEVIGIGATYLRIIGPGAILFAIAFVSNGVINGAGYTRITLIFTIVALWVIRVPSAVLLSKTTLGITGVWIGMVVSFASTMTLSLIWYNTNKWKKAVIKTGTVV